MFAPDTVAHAVDSGSSCCAVCGGGLGDNVAVRLRQAHLSACPACGSWTYLPRRTAAAQRAAHDNEAYFARPYFALRRTITAAHRRRCRIIAGRLASAIHMASLRGERMLDVGCDTGSLLLTARAEWGIVPVGIDVARRPIAAAAGSGIEAYHTSIEDAPESLSGFPLITAVDVIEHVPQPAAFLQEVRRRLRPGALLYLETPNIASCIFGLGRLLARITRGRPAALLERLFPPEHIQYFTRRSLAALAGAAGFEIVRLDTRVLPWGDIAASLPIRLGLAALQALDRIAGSGILLCAVLRRPHASRPGGEAH